MTRLRKLEPIIINKVVVNIQTMQFGKVICIAFSDGSVEYRDRSTMDEIYNETNLERIMTLNQIGFTFAEDLPCKVPPCILAAAAALTSATRPASCLLAHELLHRANMRRREDQMEWHALSPRRHRGLHQRWFVRALATRSLQLADHGQLNTPRS